MDRARRPRRAARQRLRTAALAALGVNMVTLAPVAGAAEIAPGVQGQAIVRILVALLAIVGLILAGGWLLRRHAGGRATASGQMRVLGALPVGQRERIVLVQIGQTQLLLGVAPGRVQTLHVLETPVAGTGEAPAPASDSFAARLRRMMQPTDSK
ncbi:flagellar biosynthetic protein FliO [Halorhodospira neutriphila]|uniref:Flagellar protein n=1 Tax=Halorhodospira neutriphila TaxID=168379 RepID=A0ABS1E6H2_9GAMM|nr:flagellar biosynthetic protein FliO [Halorhodospira neutriphila]MBK1727088.1 flagellar biosynthetic protein FliO [Halorhodospira neutriphila]